MNIPGVFIASAAILAAVSSGASAGQYWRGDGLTLVWVKITARPGESRWQACRRVYQHDVYHVRRGRGNIMWCHIDHSRLFEYDGHRRNYNIN